MKLTTFDRQLLDTITRLRAEHDACTGGAVTVAVGMSKTYTFQRLSLMKEAGLVTWTQMPGSLRVITETADAAVRADEDDAPGGVVAADPVAEPAEPTTPQARGAITRAKNRAKQLAASE